MCERVLRHWKTNNTLSSTDLTFVCSCWFGAAKKKMTSACTVSLSEERKLMNLLFEDVSKSLSDASFRAIYAFQPRTNGTSGSCQACSASSSDTDTDATNSDHEQDNLITVRYSDTTRAMYPSAVTVQTCETHLLDANRSVAYDILICYQQILFDKTTRETKCVVGSNHDSSCEWHPVGISYSTEWFQSSIVPALDPFAKAHDSLSTASSSSPAPPTRTTTMKLDSNEKKEDADEDEDDSENRCSVLIRQSNSPSFTSSIPLAVFRKWNPTMTLRCLLPDGLSKRVGAAFCARL